MSMASPLVAQLISGNYHETRPVFVEHRSLLLCAFGSNIQAISVHTGALIGSFSGHAGLVSCIVNPNPCISSNRVITTASSSSSALNNTTPTSHTNHPEDIIVSASVDGALIVWSLVS